MINSQSYEGEKRQAIKQTLLASARSLASENPALYFPQSHIIREYNDLATERQDLPSLRGEPINPHIKDILTELVQEGFIEVAEVAQDRGKSVSSKKFYRARVSS
jgi:hypothetical protein